MKISKEKQEKISEHILSLLYSISPKSLFTSHIAIEVARDEEFIKKILLKLKKKGILNQIQKNKGGKQYLKRSRWSLSADVYSIYKKTQEQEFSNT
ncbi:MAG: hypothetical protein KJ905_01395 [Nanoarchaeota archaeon]|nr:hypothetical protein [Nanoarchaeota archaeon]MBU1501414.1 hypothetical protein [Nanoarchaeota archaeon]MBU2458935.1 hypothetical protein [Nanoarchaeota archaeon]